ETEALFRTEPLHGSVSHSLSLLGSRCCTGEHTVRTPGSEEPRTPATPTREQRACINILRACTNTNPEIKRPPVRLPGIAVHSTPDRRRHHHAPVVLVHDQPDPRVIQGADAEPSGSASRERSGRCTVCGCWRWRGIARNDTLHASRHRQLWRTPHSRAPHRCEHACIPTVFEPGRPSSEER